MPCSNSITTAINYNTSGKLARSPTLENPQLSAQSLAVPAEHAHISKPAPKGLISQTTARLSALQCAALYQLQGVEGLLMKWELKMQ